MEPFKGHGAEKTKKKQKKFDSKCSCNQVIFTMEPLRAMVVKKKKNWGEWKKFGLGGKKSGSVEKIWGGKKKIGVSEKMLGWEEKIGEKIALLHTPPNLLHPLQQHVIPLSGSTDKEHPRSACV